MVALHEMPIRLQSSQMQTSDLLGPTLGCRKSELFEIRGVANLAKHPNSHFL
jgi:hypothetical protein